LNLLPSTLSGFRKDHMSKMSKLICGVLLAFSAITVLHVYLNIGFDKLRLGSSKQEVDALRVGFLPVT
jgi:hypothetical protein